jgi:two-component system, OmpR family, alkaline phosphatase synthesis response regulator PhoP
LKRILIVASNAVGARELDSGLTQMGFACLTVNNADIAMDTVRKETLDMVLVDADGLSTSSWSSLKTKQLPKIKSAVHLPVIVLMPTGILDGVDSDFQIDDFIVRPFNLSELVVRIRRILNRTNNDGNQDSVRGGDLMIDVAKCEVSVNGRLVVLTFKEYELLKFLMRHKGKVFTREALLNEVWGYDYYGGDRTVDVHIRRLRSKVEDADHTFIETVRNIGYKFSG